MSERDETTTVSAKEFNKRLDENHCGQLSCAAEVQNLLVKLDSALIFEHHLRCEQAKLIGAPEPTRLPSIFNSKSGPFLSELIRDVFGLMDTVGLILDSAVKKQNDFIFSRRSIREETSYVG